MARRSPSDDDDDLGEEGAPPPRRKRGGRPEPEAVRPWDPGDDAPATPPGRTHRPKRPIYFRARDSLWFEPLVALCLIVLLLVSLWAYTSNWPPLYVVESPSMQHGTGYTFGAINTGDLVLAKQTSQADVTPYVSGAQTGYSTYQEYGDVILYHPSGVGTPVPIIHRAIVFIQANSDGTYTIPSLSGQSCGFGGGKVYSISSTPSGCGFKDVTGTLTLYGVGWQSVSVPISLGEMGSQSGFVTMGDNNFGPGNSGPVGYIDQPTRGGLVQESWIVGVARGLLPWFGAIKLALQGQAQDVPAASWWFMGLTVVAIVLTAFGIHYAFRRKPPQAGSFGPSVSPDNDEEGEGRAPRESRRERRRRQRRGRPDPDAPHGSQRSGSSRGAGHPPGGDAGGEF